MKIAGTIVRTLTVGAMVALMLNATAFASPPTPEVDPGMATGGLTILGVGIVLLLERYRRS